MNHIPLDIWSVKKIGIEKWHSNFYWPITKKEHHEMVRKVKAHFNCMLKNCSKNDQNVFKGLYMRLLNGTITILHNLQVVQRIIDKGYSPVVSENSSYYTEFFEERPIKNIEGMTIPTPISWYWKLRLRYRCLKENVKYHGSDPGYWSPLHFQKLFISPDSPYDQEYIDYVNDRGGTLSYRSVESFYPTSFYNVDRCGSSSKNDYLNGILSIAKQHGIHFPEEQKRGLGNILEKCTSHLSSYIYSVKQELKRMDVSAFLIHRLGNLQNRGFCAAAREVGIPVVTFNHGNSVGAKNNDVGTRMRFSLADEFVCHSNASKKLYKRSLNKISLHGQEKPRISVVRNDRFQNLKSRMDSDIPSQIRDLMILEAPMRPTVHRDYYLYWPFQLEVLLHTSEILEEHSVNTIIKRHPDRLKESKILYDNYFDDQLTKPFEKVYDQADAYLFPHIRTSTFEYSLFTNRPVIILSYSLDEFWESAQEKLKKRCCIVPSWFDDKDRIRFDKERLNEVLDRTPERPDHAFTETYHLSSEC